MAEEELYVRSPINKKLTLWATALMFAQTGLTSPAHAQTVEAEDDAPHIKFGGAVRFNYGWLDYGSTQRLRLELLRADVNGSAGSLFFSAQYRWYRDYSTIHHAWVGWKFDNDSDIRAGIQQVPFGLLPVASHSFWLGSGYYLGLEDNYDLGVVWQHHEGNHQWHLGYFASDEYGTGRNYDRYAFDVASTTTLPYRERGQLNLRYEYTDHWNGGTWHVGASALLGQIERTDTGDHYQHDAAALHAQWDKNAWSWQAQWARYRYHIPGDRIAMAASQSTFEVARAADVPSLNVAYKVPHTGRLDAITCYNDLSATLPVGDAPGLSNSVQNVTGCSFGKGPLLVYLDWITGKNMKFSGGDGVGLATPTVTGWHSRLNLNIGFYF